jgi:MFS family permease
LNARAALRPIVALGITQIVGYGTLYYAFGVVALDLSDDLGITLPFAFGAFSLALLAGGAAAPIAGRLIDSLGARKIMAAGSIAAAMSLMALSQVTGALGLIAALVFVEAVAAFVLYDAAFAALAQAVGARGARRAITLMTLLGGFASTIFWPATLFLMEDYGWRQTFLIFAILHIVVCLPLHLSLPEPETDDPGGLSRNSAATPPAFAPLPQDRHRVAMIHLALGFSLGGVVLSALAAQWVPVLAAMGLSSADAVAAGVLMGPAQVGVRLIDLAFGVRRHPLTVAILATGFLVIALAVLLLAPPGLIAAMIFAVSYGLAGGLTSIVRGTVPLVLFGSQGYATRLGLLAGARMFSSAVAPVAMATALALWDARIALALALGFAIASGAALWRVPR